MTEKKSMSDLLKELADVKARLESAEAEVSLASSNCIRAKNAYNDVTKRIDTAMEEIRKEAPRDTDWARKERGK